MRWFSATLVHLSPHSPITPERGQKEKFIKYQNLFACTEGTNDCLSSKHRSNRILPGTGNITLGFLATTRELSLQPNFPGRLPVDILAQNCQYLEYIKKLQGNVLSSSHQLKYLWISGSFVLTNYPQYHHKTCRIHILTSQHDQIKSSHRLNTA